MLPVLLALASLAQETGEPLQPPPVLLDRELATWAAMPPAPGAWRLEGGLLVGRGTPLGFLRSRRALGDLRLSFRWRRPEGGPAPTVLLRSAALPETGAARPAGIALDLPDPGDREWHRVRVELRGKTLRQQADGAAPEERQVPEGRGHLAFAADGRPLEIGELEVVALGPPPPSPLPPPEEDWRALYNGADLSGWRRGEEARSHWHAEGERLVFDGGGDHLWTLADFADVELVLDWRWPAPPVRREVPVVLADGSVARNPDGSPRLIEIADAGDSGVFLRGSEKAQVNLWCWPVGSGGIYGYRTDAALPPEIRAAATPARPADRPPGEWNRLRVLLRGERVRVWVNGTPVVPDAWLPGLPPRGPLGLQAHGSPVEFTNLYVRSLPSFPSTRPEPNRHRPERLQALVQEARVHRDAPVVFLGDGVVEQFATRGRTAWQHFYGDGRGLNLGLAWERTENLLWRLQAGQLDGLRPRLVVLEIGGENLLAGHTPEQVTAGVAAVLDELRRRLPATCQILLLAVLPRGASPADPLRASIRETNSRLADLADGKRVHWFDPGWALVEADGSLSPDVSWDGHHLTVTGYRLLAVALEPVVSRLLGEAPSK